MTDQFTTYDAAYLLGALTPQDRASFEEHLATCKDCRHSVNELAGLPGLLASVPADRARTSGQPGPDVPDTLLPRLLAEVERARFRRRWTTGLVGAAAAAVLVVLVAFGVQRLSSPDGSTQIAEPLGVVRTMEKVLPDAPITATARLDDKAWGTLIQVRCTYTGDEPPSGNYPHEEVTYTMVVVDEDGRAQQIAEWAAVPGEDAIVDGSTSVPQTQIAAVNVLGPDQQPVLTLEP